MPDATNPRYTFRCFEDLEIGMTASMERTVSGGDVDQFANVSGDHNPLHLDPAYARQTIFGGCIAHGMLTASYISAVFAMKLPGPGAIYVSQSLNFRGPVRVGDVVTTTVTVTELYPSKQRALFDCECTSGGKKVLTGEAILMLPARSA